MRELRAGTEMTGMAFAEHPGIPLRTVEDWEIKIFGTDFILIKDKIKLFIRRKIFHKEVDGYVRKFYVL